MALKGASGRILGVPKRDISLPSRLDYDYPWSLKRDRKSETQRPLLASGPGSDFKPRAELLLANPDVSEFCCLVCQHLHLHSLAEPSISYR